MDDGDGWLLITREILPEGCLERGPRILLHCMLRSNKSFVFVRFFILLFFFFFSQGGIDFEESACSFSPVAKI